MECYDVLELVSSVVDDRLEARLLEEFKIHTGVCDICRNVYELELLTKKFAHSTLKSYPAPGYLSEKIVSQIINSSANKQVEKKKTNWIINFPKHLFIGTTVVAAAILVIIILSGSPHHLHTSPNDNNIIHQAYNNYDAVMQGKMIPAFKTDDHSMLANYFKTSVDQPVDVPSLNECLLKGGAITEYSGKKLLHLFYNRGECIIHCTLVDLNIIQNETTFVLPEGALDSIKKNGWYFADGHKCCSVILWVKNNTLIAAAAALDRNQLFAYLNESESLR